MDEVVIAAPYCISEDLLKHFKVSTYMRTFLNTTMHAVPVIIYIIYVVTIYGY